jgi:hypothetical protein
MLFCGGTVQCIVKGEEVAPVQENCGGKGMMRAKAHRLPVLRPKPTWRLSSSASRDLMVLCAISRSLLRRSRSAINCTIRQNGQGKYWSVHTCCSHCLNRASSALTCSVNFFLSCSSSSLNLGLSSFLTFGSPNFLVSICCCR